MATAGNEDKDSSGVLTCTICLEIFTNPKYLPCLHTLCESCIQTYITSGFEEGKTISFDCPVCRGQVKIPHENCKPEEWAQSLPVNILLLGLVEKQKLIKSEKMCMLCERMSGESSSANFYCLECADTLCKACERYHRSIKLTSNHDIKSLEDLPSSEIPLSAFTDYTCAVHKGKRLRYFCSDHEMPCCSTCVAIGHRKCEKVDTLEDAAEGIANSQTVIGLKKKIDDALSDVTSVLENQNDGIKTLDSQYETGLQTIGDVFCHLRNHLNEQEELRKGELLKRFNETKDQIETTVVIFENSKKALENEQKILEISTNEASEVDLIIGMPNLKKQADIFVKRIQENSCNLQKFKLMVENVDTSLIDEAVNRTCSVKCNKTNGAVENFRNDDREVFKFNRFSSLGTNDSWWKVQSNVDAISFTVSENIALGGVLSYGPKNQKSCTLEAKVLKGEDLLTTVKTSLEDKTYGNNITKIYFDKPVTLVSGFKYDIIYTMTGEDFCNYGEDGRSEVKCECVKFQFSKSSKSNNGTDTTKGQIPGFIFRKV